MLAGALLYIDKLSRLKGQTDEKLNFEYLPCTRISYLHILENKQKLHHKSANIERDVQMAE